MSRAPRSLRNSLGALCGAVLVLGVGYSVVEAGGIFDVPAVGGILIDAEGVVREPTVDDTGKLAELRRKRLGQPEGDLAEATEMRMISLKKLQEKILDCQRRVMPIPAEVRVLAGLQRVQYVFVYPEENDIVLAGPAEGWKIDDRGNIVGVKSGRSPILLDDLLVALRTTNQAAEGGLSCSIDPTQEGMQRLNEYTQRVLKDRASGSLKGFEDSLGPQTITVRGVPESSHFARVLVAADYRMKRLAMAFDPPAVPNMPSYLKMVNAKNNSNMMPRWWLTTNYESLHKDADGLAWEIRGQGVKAMTEDELVGADGTRKRTGKANDVAQKWADMMTDNFDKIAAKAPIFGELRNLMDLAVVAALIEKEALDQKAGCDLSLLRDGQQLETEELAAPKQVPSMASSLGKGRNTVISVSGGVEVLSWQATENVDISPDLDTTHQRAAAKPSSDWWWNG